MTCIVVNDELVRETQSTVQQNGPSSPNYYSNLKKRDDLSKRGNLLSISPFQFLPIGFSFSALGSNSVSGFLNSDLDSSDFDENSPSLGFIDSGISKRYDFWLLQIMVKAVVGEDTRLTSVEDRLSHSAIPAEVILIISCYC